MKKQTISTQISNYYAMYDMRNIHENSNISYFLFAYNTLVIHSTTGRYICFTVLSRTTLVGYF